MFYFPNQLIYPKLSNEFDFHNPFVSLLFFDSFSFSLISFNKYYFSSFISINLKVERIPEIRSSV